MFENKIQNQEGFYGHLASCAALRHRWAKSICRVAVIAACWAGLAGFAQAGTINVNSTAQRAPATSADCTLAAAILSANSNSPVDGCTISGPATTPYIINIPAGTYTLNSVDNTDLQGVPFGLPLIRNTMTLQGAASATTIIARNSSLSTPSFGVLPIGQNVDTITLNDLSFTGGKNTGFGGGVTIFNGAKALVVNRCRFESNTTAGEGGAIDGFNNAPVTISDSTFFQNSAATQGGAVVGLVTASNSNFVSNSAPRSGAISCLGGGCFVTIQDSTFDSNQTTSGGGGAIESNGSILRSVFTQNTSNSGDGGAVRAGSGAHTMDITDSFFFLNASNAGSGGAVSCSNCTISGSTFAANSTIGANTGGGAYRGSGSVLTNDTFWENSAAEGGAIVSDDGGVYNNLTLTLNASDPGPGGGIEFNGGAALIRNSIVA